MVTSGSISIAKPVPPAWLSPPIRPATGACASPATRLDGKISSTVKYDQLYNDQFNTNGDLVTYADGTPVLVDPNDAGGPATEQLTLTMLNDPDSLYWADPDPNSGSIRSTAVRAALTQIDPAHGQAATGVTGLPIAEIQYDFVNPHNGTVTVVEDGDLNTGINEYSFNFQNNYTFDDGRVEGRVRVL